MVFFLRRLLILLCLLVLLAACGTGGDRSNRSSLLSRPGVTATPSANSSQGTTICPRSVRNFSGCFTPTALRQAYGVESLLQKGFTGKGQTVIDIVSFGSPTLQEDMKVFDRQFGLPPIDLQIISPLKAKEYDPLDDKSTWAFETNLDVQIIHAIAPEAKVVVLVSPVAETEGTIGLPEFRQLEQYALDHKLGNIVTQSWGASELTLQDAAGQQELKKWNEFLQKATLQQHVTYFSSSGDNGATDYADLNGSKLATVPTTSFAASSPWVTSVGGTTLQRNGAGFTEKAWSDIGDGQSSGGGFSRFYPMPAYQKTLPASVQAEFNHHRGVPDVAAAADPYTGLAVYTSGSWGLAGGTSAATPLWAGLMAIANQMAGHPLGFINPALYKLGASPAYTQDFRDITSGDNTNRLSKVPGYKAVPGWDAVTGLGAPDAEKLLPDLVKAIT
ncbi:protease [Ktedonosporobacter rubrisoli]|uniref:Protease n=1 Tax=Ktedonosporobacter rubrisoli TaxID=2509675 RepID=A0A4P6JUP7_KTERU|nr:S53 family peptidase [Ktedonosporobacter rubrisoli]QBD79214.1 protease [Ktedonosporobacter rubrisoli]